MEVGRRAASLTMQPETFEKKGQLVLCRVLCRFKGPVTNSGVQRLLLLELGHPM